MPRNVEIKARIRDPETVRQRVENQCAAPPEVLEQEDTYFHVPEGRVKLRTFGDGSGELIAYRRSDAAGPTLSTFHLYPTRNPAGLGSFLTAALGVRGVVKKRRHLYWIGQTRVHLDEVEGLGAYLELEVVLEDGQTEEEGAAIADRILADLGVGSEDRIDRAYIDLLEDRSE